MTIEGFLGAIIIGAIIGALGRLLLPGRQPIGILWTILVGIVAALIGTFIVGSMRDTNGIDWVEVLVQVILAVIGVAAVASFKRGRTT
ncbi:GlsB/YeaQ/YmgE family stress response membrane protein [Angustibacter luteus]|uniref:GlsB/YeaQ/YmgE family stress response membrane protein n=1 Tax=Angustibacter luteus TaxID=658456 RepID=A0ABW1JFZ0_9ACTN